MGRRWLGGNGLYKCAVAGCAWHRLRWEEARERLSVWASDGGESATGVSWSSLVGVDLDRKSVGVELLGNWIVLVLPDSNFLLPIGNGPAKVSTFESRNRFRPVDGLLSRGCWLEWPLGVEGLPSIQTVQFVIHLQTVKKASLSCSSSWDNASASRTKPECSVEATTMFGFREKGSAGDPFIEIVGWEWVMDGTLLRRSSACLNVVWVAHAWLMVSLVTKAPHRVGLGVALRVRTCSQLPEDQSWIAVLVYFHGKVVTRVASLRDFPFHSDRFNG
nr:hypothetical protein L203_06240 [Cryptococcus depauperatus CBS 7841]